MQRIPISSNHVRFFHRHGFVVLDHHPLINPKTPSGATLLESLRQSFHRCFEHGKFDYHGNYPDEWHWRKGISREDPGVVREICNGWKADRTVRQVVLSKEVGQIGGGLMRHWKGSRIGQDDMVWKIANRGIMGDSSEPTTQGSSLDSESDAKLQQQRRTIQQSNNSYVGYHIDSSYISDQFLKKPGQLDSDKTSVTIWIALDDADEDNGGIEYVCGSHKVLGSDSECADQLKDMMSFHNSNDPEAAKRKLVEVARENIDAMNLAKGADAGDPDSDEPKPGSIFKAKVPLGHCVVHHQNTLHGSPPNVSWDRHRRALVVHLLQGDTDGGSGELEFIDNPGYIYGRYKLNSSRKVSEDFFPVTWRRDSDSSGE